jgi:universal stress protein E
MGAHMDKLESILVTVDRSNNARHTLAKASALAGRFGARLELFLCDAEHAYALKHEYDSRDVSDARESCLEESRRYLERLRASADFGELRVGIDAMCESPLYEGIVHRVQQSCPDLVIRSIGDFAVGEPAALSTTDWALVRTCPAPLMLTRGRAWGRQPRIAAAVDTDEAPELTHAILRTAAFLKTGCEGVLGVVYGADATESSAPAIESHQAVLRKRVEEAEVQAEQLHVLVGEPAKTLPRFAADHRYDVLVLGALTHRKAPATLVGTLTGKLIEALDCDFLLVKPATYVCPVGKELVGGATMTGRWQS